MCRRRAIETGLQRERPKERRTESKIRALRERGRQRTGGETGREFLEGSSARGWLTHKVKVFMGYKSCAS